MQRNHWLWEVLKISPLFERDHWRNNLLLVQAVKLNLLLFQAAKLKSSVFWLLNLSKSEYWPFLTVHNRLRFHLMSSIHFSLYLQSRSNIDYPHRFCEWLCLCIIQPAPKSFVQPLYYLYQLASDPKTWQEYESPLSTWQVILDPWLYFSWLSFPTFLESSVPLQ